MRPAVEAEKLGIPSVVVTLTNFVTVAQLAAKAAGVEHLSIAEYPGAIGVHLPEIREKVTNVLFDRIVSGLTRPPTSATSRSTAAPSTTTAAWDPQEIVCRGSFDDVSAFFKASEWTDGLPIVPPTRERVEAFLRYTDRAPSEEIAILPQANRRAVPWNVAVNGVMAGCRPVDMPILIAAVEAMADERYNLNNIGTTWGIIPYLLINGPIIKQLGIECGPQLISRGLNPAIGRAIGLIVRNIAGFRPGASYMGTFGYPLAFALAENEDESPWAPFHVDQGFDRDASTVTVGVTNNWGAAPAPYDTPERAGAQVALELLCREITGKTRLYNFPGRGPNAEKVMLTLLLSPPVAKSLADAGYSKEDVKRHIHENARMPLREFEWVLKYTMIMRTTLRERVEAGILPPEFLGKPDDRVQVLSSPDILHIVVCGDPHRNRVMVLEGGHTQPTTRRIELPPNAETLTKQPAG